MGINCIWRILVALEEANRLSSQPSYATCHKRYVGPFNVLILDVIEAPILD